MGVAEPSLEDAPEANAVGVAARRSWARHALNCCKGAGRRAATHDEITDVFVVMLVNAGFQDVVLEDQWWDAAAAYSDTDHRRPYITCRHPRIGGGRVKLVLDVVVYWADSEGELPGGGGQEG